MLPSSGRSLYLHDIVSMTTFVVRCCPQQVSLSFFLLKKQTDFVYSLCSETTCVRGPS